MSVRSLNLKLLLRRNAQGLDVRRSIWLTHRVVNEAVAECERVLLLCRGSGYLTGGGESVPAEQVHREALAFARTVQIANGKPDCGSDDEVLSALREFYEAVIPSIVLNEKGQPLSADANKQAAAFAGPIMSPQSEGGQKVFDKVLDQLPEWVIAMEKGQEGWEKASLDWLKTPQAEPLLRQPNRPPKWLLKVRTGKPWQQEFAANQEKMRKDVTGVPSLLRRMKADLGLLPLVAPPIASRFADSRPGLTPWDRQALRLAVAHLLSWESWNHRAATEHGRVRDRRDRQAREVEAFGDLVEKLRLYEAHRHEQLKLLGLADDRRPYRIGIRATRAWDRVSEVWSKSGVTKQNRLSALGDLQTRLGGKFGDPDLLRWLAEDGREPLWRATDLLPSLARLNGLDRLLERKKNRAVYTPPDAQLHPRWLLYAAPGAGNLREYDLDIRMNTCVLTLPLLTEDNGRLKEVTEEIVLAPSGQLDSPDWSGQNRKDYRLHFTCAHQRLSAKLGGGEVLLYRRHLQNRQPEELAHGDVGPVWWKLVIDLDSQAPAEWLDARGRIVTPAVVHHFKTALANKSKHSEGLAPGLRVLSVDLGLRTFAACSVFQLVQGRPNQRLTFLADAERDLWARHERSFLLALPGESPRASAAAAREQAFDELGAIQRDLRRLKQLLRMSVRDSYDDLLADIGELAESVELELARGRTTLFSPTAIENLEAIAGLAQPMWHDEIEKQYHSAEKVLAERISVWRKRTKPRASGRDDRIARRGYNAGKSIWAVQYLDAVRRLLQGWSLHGRRFGEIRRLDREASGTFAFGLLEHINAIKTDRVKTGSDLIVQAARGLVPDAHRGWVARHDPCRLILFEDLSRYRFRTDRPRRENSQLMRWSHRQIVAVTAMQAEVYGIVVDDTTGAGFTSRFHARTGAPGFRTRILSADDLSSPAKLDLLAERLGADRRLLVQGTRVPWEGGEELAVLGPGNDLVVAHADVNAAQNLHRRFWTRHSDAFRIPAIEIRQGGGGVFYYPERDGPRLRGALATLIGGDGYARLVPAADGDGFQLQSVSKAKWSRATSGQAVSGDEIGLDEVEAELAEATDTDEFEQGGRKTFFRDPSGLVLRSDRWYEAKEFWGRVQRRIAVGLGLIGSKAGRTD